MEQEIINSYSKLSGLNVSRETFLDFESYISMILEKNEKINLISNKFTEKNEIIVGEKNELIKKKINLKNLNLLADKKFFDENIFVKVRSSGKLLKSKLNLENGKTSLTLLEDEYGISPGQACVFYKKDINGDRVLGGGWITR